MELLQDVWDVEYVSSCSSYSDYVVFVLQVYV